MDLKQNQASLHEAKVAGDQSRVLFVFTIVTIVFVSQRYLPLLLPY